MTIFELLDAQKDFVGIQNFCDTYGVVIESCEEKQGKGFLDFHIEVRFSLPGEYGDGILEGKDVTDLQKEFKQHFKESMIKTWKNEGEVMDGEEAEGIFNYFKFMCRMRVGEIYTEQKQREAISRTREAIEAVKQRAKQQEEFVEV